jgi:hypothetical protein
MEENSQKMASSFLGAIKHLSNIYFVFLLIFGIVLFDDLGIMVLKKGLLDTDFSEFASLSNIPFLLLFLAVFGIVVAGLSPLADTLVFKIFSEMRRIFLMFKPFNKKPQKRKDINDRNTLYKIALIAENSFLLEYLHGEYKIINNMRKFSCAVYSLLLSIFLNLALTGAGKKTVIYYISDSYRNCPGILYKIVAAILLLPVVFGIFYGIANTVSDDQFSVYYPDAKYNKLVEESEQHK